MGPVLVDTSVLIDPPSEAEFQGAAISVVTLAELERGVLVAGSVPERVARIARLARAREAFLALPFDELAAHEYAVLAARERDAGKGLRILDTQIAATARGHGLTLVTRDRNQARLVDDAVLVE